MLTTQERDEVLVAILRLLTGQIAHTPEDIHQLMLRLSKRLHNKEDFSREEILPEEEIKTSVGNGMYDIGDYVIINGVLTTYKGKILEKTASEGLPAYRVQNMEEEWDVQVVKEKDIQKRIPTSVAPTQCDSHKLHGNRRYK